jgi:hypothetical protein
MLTRILTLAIATFVLVVTAHAAGTIISRDDFVKLVSKYAPTSTPDLAATKAKVPCVCAADDRAGIVAHVVNANQVDIHCWIPTFAADGTLQSAQSCKPFEVIAK